MSDLRRIAFLGIGNMGTPMAGHLVHKGFDVAVFDLRADVVAAFVRDRGGRAATSPADAARGAQAVITMLPDGKAVRTAVLGPMGDAGAQGGIGLQPNNDGRSSPMAPAVQGLAPGGVVIDMSTSDPADTQALGADLAARGFACVDAPVMGGVLFARDATLDIMAGGDPVQVERVGPVLAALGRKVFVCGPLGSGHALKALLNYVNACALANMLETLVAGAKFGIDTGVAVEAMQAMCTGRNHPLDKKLIPQVLTRGFGTGMAMGLIAKDVRIAIETARAAGAATPLGDCVAGLWEAAAKELGGRLDQTEIVRYWESRAGVEIGETKDSRS